MKKIILLSFSLLLFPLFAHAESFNVEINNDSNMNNESSFEDVESSSSISNFCTETITTNGIGGNGTIATCNSQGDLNMDTNQSSFTNSSVNVEVFNSDTGADSSNAAAFRSSMSALFKNLNKMGLLNNINFEALTGENSANFNTGDGFVGTGDADVEIAVENLGNVNEICIGESCENGGIGGDEDEDDNGGIGGDVPGVILGAADNFGGIGGGVEELVGAGAAIPVIAFMIYMLFSIYLAKRLQRK